MERLTQTSGKGGVAFTFDLDITCQPSEAKKILKLAEKLKSYEDAEEQGRLIKLPCKVGDTVYHVVQGRIVEVSNVDLFFLLLSVAENRFNNSVFLTKSEAEAKLKELRGRENE